jgi:hypothetical protein
MDTKTRQSILLQIEHTFNDVVTLLEENRYEPSERGAGTAPHDSAVEEGLRHVVDLVEAMADYDISVGDLSTEPGLEQIIAEIEASQENNIAHDFACLKEIDDFVRDNGEDKYKYQNTVFEHTPTKKFICVEEQRGRVGHDDFITLSVTVSETEKKEKVSYEWS